MKTAREILEKNASALQPQSWTSTTPVGSGALHAGQGAASAREINQTTKTMINMVFTRFMAIYGHKFKSSFETETEMRIAKREWAMSLGDFSENELVAAVSIAKETMAWAPSIAEFLTILQQLNDAFGLPDVRHAYREACFNAQSPTSHAWSHNVVYQAGRETGWFELRSEEEKVTFPRFNYHYEIMCRRFRKGEILEQPVAVAIEDKQTNTLFIFIQQWAKDHQLSPEVGSSLLYYMTKPEGSKTRANFRTKSQQRITEMALTLELPQ